MYNWFLLKYSVKVTHQYTLVDEQGPAHKKTFFVKLQIGDREEYSASGPSIKKAQHAAAAIALEKTEYKHPPPKPLRRNGDPLLKGLHLCYAKFCLCQIRLTQLPEVF